MNLPKKFPYFRQKDNTLLLILGTRMKRRGNSGSIRWALPTTQFLFYHEDHEDHEEKIILFYHEPGREEYESVLRSLRASW